MDCIDCGYSPADVTSYQCKGNGGHICGHKAFDTKILSNAKARSTARSMQNLLCKACVKNTRSCFGCTKHLPQTAFSKNMWHHARDNQRIALCITCIDVGMAARHTQRDTCTQCGKEYGHNKFDKHALYNSKRQQRTTNLLCKHCHTKNAGDTVAVTTRTTTLLSTA